MKYILLLYVLFVANYSIAQSIKGDMETWRSSTVGTYTVMQPNGWNSLDSIFFRCGPLVDAAGSFNHQVLQSVDAHSGSYSAMLVTHWQDTFLYPAVLTNAQPVFDMSKADHKNFFAAISLTGGLATTSLIQSITVWVKYIPRHGDMAGIYAYHVIPGAGAGGYDSIVGQGHLNFSTVGPPSWSPLTISLSYTSSAIPTHFQIVIYSSDLYYSTTFPQDSTILYVDDVTYSTTGITPVTLGQPVVNVFPNPTHGMIYLHEFNGETLNWQAYDLQGKLVAEQNFTGRTYADMSQSPDGMYFYRITNAKGDIVQRGRFSLVR